MRVILLALLMISTTQAQEKKLEWRELFNGKDLSGWRLNPTNYWVVKDGEIAWKESAVDLWTEEEFGDFILELEFKCSPGCNSGVFVRTADIKDNVQSGIEVQIWDSYGKTKMEKHYCAAIYDALEPSKNAERKIGEWNAMRITAKGPAIVVELNGERVIDMDLDKWSEAGKNPDGTANKYKKPLKDFPRKGFIGLQDHHKAVWFRNVRIKTLP
ncbi:MAG TPA: DUF1080 domain-containing protein [Tepidisphaeraceae bacterium]|nr:DUF1080 domain-containing protein [Tepidisphaeraceae bacterium]